jgi:hypothetical protein
MDNRNNGLSEHVILTDEGGKDLDSGCGNEILHSTAFRSG